MMHPIPSSPTHCSKSVATHCGNNVSSSCVHMIVDIVCFRICVYTTCCRFFANNIADSFSVKPFSLLSARSKFNYWCREVL